MSTIAYGLLTAAPISYEYTDATARAAATGFLSGDLGKLAWQHSDDTVWLLTATTPTWVAVGGAYTLPTATSSVLGGVKVGGSLGIASGVLDVPNASTSAKGVAQLATPSSDVSAGHVVQASDARLSDSRTPSAHAATHLSAGSDPVAAATTSAAGLVQLATPSSDTTAGHVVQASDTRLSNSRTPTAHASTHLSGGSDAIAAATTSAAGIVQLATPSSDTTAGHVVQASDTRLSNSRAPSGSAGGDLGGTYPNPTVTGLQGHAVDTTAPTAGQILHYVAGIFNKYVPTSLFDALGFSSPGDLLYVDAGGNLAVLAIGGPGQVLTVDPTGTVPEWV